MVVSLIVAMAKNRVIGRDNAMPWRIPGELGYFKRMTMGKPVIMGRKTFESIGKPLPGRPNIVITRQMDWAAEGVQVVHTVADALAAGRALTDGEVMVIGGAQIYAEVLSDTDRLYVTEIDRDFDGDAFFPEIGEGWKLVSSTPGARASDDVPPHFFNVYERLSA